MWFYVAVLESEFVYYNFGSVCHLLVNSCQLDWPFVLIVFFLSPPPPFQFEERDLVLIAPVPVHCFSIT